MSDTLKNCRELKNSGSGFLLPLYATCSGFIAVAISTGVSKNTRCLTSGITEPCSGSSSGKSGSAGARNIAAMVTTKGINLSHWRAKKLMTELNITRCQQPGHHYKKASKDAC